jgi:hypothetical protein
LRSAISIVAREHKLRQFNTQVNINNQGDKDGYSHTRLIEHIKDKGAEDNITSVEEALVTTGLITAIATTVALTEEAHKEDTIDDKEDNRTFA